MALQKFNSLMENKELNKDNQVKLEKNDMLALIVAATSVFLPVILVFMALIAIIMLFLF